MKQRKGLVLIVTLIVTFIASAFIAALLYMLFNNVVTIGSKKRYSGSLEVAKGVSSYLMELMDDDKLCSYTDCSKTNQPIQLGSYSSFGNYNATATLIKRIDLNNKGEGVVYSVEVIVRNQKIPSEHSVIDFVYRVY
ncbi:hypothetical protein BLW93_00810 [Desulfurobacterium indicum]|uniref:Type 4 fimbrial biogenesis protein PilX N-terminal domain-containing protein n=1 Tax=Desulfurobacterium indicum TaxID=1914305 RepID=A0A1R1MN40_9BACT|nr:hypothetical protein BLW93_00810 [Desulfurobacterium indicum]